MTITWLEMKYTLIFVVLIIRLGCPKPFDPLIRDKISMFSS